MLPIFNNRQIIGYAKNEKQAEKIVRKLLSPIPRGFLLTVWKRPKHLQEILGMPEGFIYSIAY